MYRKIYIKKYTLRKYYEKLYIKIMCIVYDEDSSCQKLHAKVVHKIMFISYIVPNIEVVEKNTSKKK